MKRDGVRYGINNIDNNNNKKKYRHANSRIKEQKQKTTMQKKSN